MSINSENTQSSHKTTEDQGTEWVAGAVVCIALLQYAGINVIGIALNFVGVMIGAAAIPYAPVAIIVAGIYLAPQLTFNIAGKLFEFGWEASKTIIGNFLNFDNEAVKQIDENKPLGTLGDNFEQD